MVLLRFISKLDIFGEPVSLFYRKKTHFKTAIGGFFFFSQFWNFANVLLVCFLVSQEQRVHSADSY